MLFVDDLQWSDLDSTHVLGELLRRPDPPKLLFIGAYRSDEAATSPPLRALLAMTGTSDFGVDTRTLALQELDPMEVRALVAAVADTDESSVARLMDLVHRESGGNSFFVHELTRLAVSHGPSMGAGGDHGAALIDAADAWLRAQLVVEPISLHRMITGWIC